MRTRLAEIKFEPGEPQKCFANAAIAVNAEPDTLLYVEGYMLPLFIYHAWVKEVSSGRIHEVTLTKAYLKRIGKSLTKQAAPFDWQYIGKEFTHNQMWERLEIKREYSPLLTEEEEEALWETIPVPSLEQNPELWYLATTGRRNFAGDDVWFFNGEAAESPESSQ